MLIARGSLYELETQTHVARRLDYLDSATSECLFEQSAEVGRLVHGLIKSLRQSNKLVGEAKRSQYSPDH